MSTPSIWERLRYWFDNTMSKGTPALIGWLGMVTLMVIGVITALTALLAPGDVGSNPLRAAWLSLLRALDPGTMGADTGSAVFLALMLAVTLGGIFLISSLVGVLATGLDAKLTELRKGRSRVLERDHTVVLGWSDQIFTIVSELVKANDGARGCVTILADRDKVAMEDEVRSRLGATGRVRVVCRTGSPTERGDLDLVRPEDASAIIVVVPMTDDRDVHVIRTLLALCNRPWPQLRPHIVAAVADTVNMPAAELAGGPGVQIVDCEDVIARLVVQSSRQPGLSTVWTELLNFDGDEIYMRAEPDLVGTKYGEALFAYRTACPIGLHRSDGTVVVNPPADTEIREDDELVLLAESSSSIRLADGHRADVVEAAISASPPRPAEAERALVLGWNPRGPTIVRLLDRYLAPGSFIEIAGTAVNGGTAAAIGDLSHMKVATTRCDPTGRRALEALDPGRFDHVILLADDDLDPHHADSRTLVTLLHLRDMKERRLEDYAIVSELNDDANRRLADVTRADDFVVGNKLISLLLTQLSTNRHLSALFSSLFDAQGPDIYLRPADEYLVPGAVANFTTVVQAALRRGETALGYRMQADAYVPPNYGVVLNPERSAPLSLGPADRVVVLGQD